MGERIVFTFLGVEPINWVGFENENSISCADVFARNGALKVGAEKGGANNLFY